LGEKKKLERFIACDEKMTALEELTPDSKSARDRVIWTKWVSDYISRVSEDTEDTLQLMKSSNPAFVLRNWVALKSIERAESGDYSHVRLLLDMLTTPYDERFSPVTGKGMSCSIDPITDIQAEYVRRGEMSDNPGSEICTCSS